MTHLPDPSRGEKRKTTLRSFRGPLKLSSKQTEGGVDPHHFNSSAAVETKKRTLRLREKSAVSGEGRGR